MLRPARSLAGLLLSIAAAAPGVLAVQVPAAVPAAPPAAPDMAEQRVGRVGAGPLHKVFARPGEEAQAAALRAAGAVVFEHDYGAFTLLVVHEGMLGGRAALLAGGLQVRDEQDLVALNGWLLDGRSPSATLAELPPGLRFGGPDAGLLDPFAGLYLVQFVGPATDAWLERLDATGARRVQYQPSNAWVVAADPDDVARLAVAAGSDPAIQWVGEYEPAFRLRPVLREAATTGRGVPRAVTVQLVDGPGVRRAVQTLEGLAGGLDLVRRVGPYLNVEVVLDPAILPALARDPAVFAIEPRGTRARRDERQGSTIAGNVNATGPNDTDYLGWLAGRGFDSSQFGSFAVNVVDDAMVINGHPDVPFARIAFQRNPTNQTGGEGGHGFLNAHIVAGFNDQAGSVYEDAGGYNYGLGIAPWARVGSTAIFGPTFASSSSWESTAYSLGARISSNSWSYVDSFQNPIPDYDSSAQEYDGLVRDARSSQGGNQEYLIVFAAGNDGPSSNTVSTPSTAKNVLTVGAGENNRQTGTDGCGVTNSGANDVDDVIDFSSHGPVNSAGGDGRFKPEVMAPGTHIQAGIPQSNYVGGSVCNMFWPSGSTLYGWSSGTSHSTPAVAGGAALVYQWFLNQSMAAPSPAMNKAVLTATAEWMNGAFAADTLPSNSQGFGRMNVGRAFDATPKMFVDQASVLGSTGSTYELTGTVADAGQPFRVVLCWTDAPGSTTGAPWVNDLDLQVAVGGSVYRGNVFSGATSVTGGSFDFRNNTEAVFRPAGASGPFTVTVTAATIAGNGVPGNADGTDQDFALYVYNGTTGGGPTPPTANFTGSPLSGVAPLTVDFTDASVGTVDTWSWTFGDGGTSTLQDPSHTYTVPGTYTVTLDVTGPDGSDGEIKPGYVSVASAPAPGVGDGSFEGQTAGTAPTTPWSIVFGTGHVVNPSGVSSDNGMPSDGSQWCEVAADSTNDASPPTNPGGAGSPPSGGAGVSQQFTYPAGQTELSFDAAFLRNEDAGSVYNDWMSVDVTDGATWVNVYYKDTFSATSGSSSKYGYAMTPVEAVTVDLAALFPSSTSSTLFTLTVQVGNGADDFQPSKGYIDDVRLAGAAAPPLAEFSADPTSGTVPLLVSFTDLSSGSVSSWSWTFGDGGTSSAQNPSHNYTAAGTYDVSLTATGPGGADVETKAGHITVNPPPPTANFIANVTSGVAPLEVTFANLTGPAATSWSWTFGDGGTSTLEHPVHTYAAAGVYDVTLVATGPGGVDGETKLAYITVNDPPPVANFTADVTTGVAPLSVSFTDLTSGAVTSWSWTFGDGGTSTLQSPAHTYTVPGTYDVTLTATGPGGVDGESKLAYITVNDPPPVANFTADVTTGVAPLSVSFTDLTSGAVTSWSWTFGDGGTSTLQSPSHTYTVPGTYDVTLTATGPGGVDGETKLAYIMVNDPPPVADFSANVTNGVAPLSVDFTDLTSGAVTSWSWTFGDGGTSTLQSPSHTYTVPGTYDVTLTATGPGGVDGETKLAYITVNDPPPVADFTADVTGGIAPLTVNFTDLSTGPITSWSWTFGDGGTSSLQSPSHTYTLPGLYDVALTVTGPGGADPLVQTALIEVWPDPWSDLGLGLAGTHGVPQLSGSGPLAGGEAMAIHLTGALESAPVVLFLGFTRWDVPLYGGTLVPDFNPPGTLFVFVTDPAGALSLGTTWPSGLPTGTELYFQYWLEDPAGAFGFAASNALQGTTP